ncbi:MAG: Asp-tRNA(Asn)/Glu-tRNA(Gln) amidotransferase subunit GatC [Patescibacteria group bacterium]|nr:Asp-tRNA(Asn)/Glu-tRNA(Gln) amidotransferase subunit GatC [Patescibacteria group bacterium]
MKLSKEEIKHIADLARLELTEAELKKYGSQLSEVLTYIDQLKEVDTIDIEPTAQITGLENALREDVKEDWDKREVEEALSQAPNLEDGQIKVKRVLDNN